MNLTWGETHRDNKSVISLPSGLPKAGPVAAHRYRQRFRREAIEFIIARDHPLALYVLTDDSKLKEKGKIYFESRTTTRSYENLQSLATPAAEVASAMRWLCRFPARGQFHCGGEYPISDLRYSSGLDFPGFSIVKQLVALLPESVGEKRRSLESLSRPLVTFPSLNMLHNIVLRGLHFRQTLTSPRVFEWHINNIWLRQ